MTGSADRFGPERGPGDGGDATDPFERLVRGGVEPLPVPEGVFAQVRRRAARRRRRRAVLGATAGAGALAAAVYLVGALVPHAPGVVVTPPATAYRGLGTPRPLPSATSRTGADPSPTPTPSAVAPPSVTPSAAPGGVPPGATASTTVATVLCTADQLSPRLAGGDAGAGQVYTYLVVTNHSAVPCHVTGFPGLSLLDAAGRQLGVPATYDHIPFTPVVLAPGASASDTIHTANRQSGAPSQCLPPSVSLRIYPPGSRASLVFPGQVTDCLGIFEVTPFGPGTTGNPAR
jgi:hypothetical protein